MCQIEVLARPILAPPSLMLYTPIYTILSETAHHSGIIKAKTGCVLHTHPDFEVLRRLIL